MTLYSIEPKECRFLKRYASLSFTKSGFKKIGRSVYF